MELDWNALQKEASTAGLLPDGQYAVVISDCTATKSANGKPMLKTKLRVTEGPQKDKPIWTQFTVSAESAMALRMFFLQMAAFGLDHNYFASNPDMDSVARALINRPAIVTLGHRTWQGQDRNQVENISPPLAGGPVAPGVVVGSPVASPVAATPVGGPPVPTATPAVPPSQPMPEPAPTTPPPAPPAPPTPAF